MPSGPRLKCHPGGRMEGWRFGGMETNFRMQPWKTRKSGQAKCEQHRSPINVYHRSGWNYSPSIITLSLVIFIRFSIWVTFKSHRDREEWWWWRKMQLKTGEQGRGQSYKTEENVFFSTGSAIMIFNNSIKNPNTEILITIVMHTEQPFICFKWHTFVFVPWQEMSHS